MKFEKLVILLSLTLSLTSCLQPSNSGLIVVDVPIDNQAPSNSSGPNSPTVLEITGDEVFTNRIAGGNQFSCSTCHSVNSTSDAFRRPGHNLSDAAARPDFKNGAVSDFRDAVNNCVEHWMVATPLEEDDQRWIALSQWLTDMAPSSASRLVYDIVQPPLDLTNGDRGAGQATFNDTCVVCHGVDATGTIRGPSLTGTQLTPERIAERVRLSGPTNTGVYANLTGGRMPFWARDQLSDEELIDIIAFLKNTTPTDVSTPGAVDISLNNARTDGSCGSDHPKVGSSGTLSTLQHRVSGTVHVVDNCTLEIRNFNFDGGGIDVQIFGGTNGNYTSGFTISRNIFGNSYGGETVRINLPSSISLDDFNGISVWCVAIGVDFGSARF